MRVVTEVTYIYTCRQCPEVRRAFDNKNFKWLICPRLDRVVGKMEESEIPPDDCPLPDKEDVKK